MRTSVSDLRMPVPIILLVCECLLWYQAYILWVELVHRASARVEVVCILFQNFVNPLWASFTAKETTMS